MTEDEKEFKEYLGKQRNNFILAIIHNNKTLHEIALRQMEVYLKDFWLASRRTLREKIKADPSIGKMVVEPEQPESPDY